MVKVCKISKRAMPILVIVTIALSVLPVPQVYAISIDYVSASSGDYGDTIIVYGSGVTAGVGVNLYWDAVKAWDGEKGLLNSTEADVYGGFEVSFDVPEAVNGSHWLWVKDAYGDTDSHPFEVVAKINLSPSIGLPGDKITIKGYGFDDEVEIVDVIWAYGWYLPKVLTTTPATPVTDTLGSWEATFKVPSGYPYGDYNVYAEDESGFYDTATFKVGAVISFDVDDGPVGTVVEISGRGFTDGYTIETGKVWIVGGAMCKVIDDDTVDAGKFKIKCVIPSVPDEDEYEIEVTDGIVTATEDFEVIGLSEIEVDPDFGLVGSTISIEGWNFTQIHGEDVQLELWDETLHFKITDLKKFETDSSGYFNGTFRVPARSAGKYTLVATQDDYYINASAGFRIILLEFGVVLIPPSGPSGSVVFIHGAGFTENGDWNATLGDKTIIEDGTIDDEGNLELGPGVIPTFIVPTMDPGTYIFAVNDITDIDDIITVEVEFTVTATTTVTLDPIEAPNGYEIMIMGNHFSAWADLDFVLYNVTADGEVDEEWNMHVIDEEGYPVMTYDEGNFTGYWEVFGSDVLSLGDYWINVTDENDLYAQAMFRVSEISRWAIVCSVWTADSDGDPKVRFDHRETVYVYWNADGYINMTIYAPDGITVEKEWTKLRSSGVNSFIPTHGLGVYEIRCTGAESRHIAVGTFFIIPELPLYGSLLTLATMIGVLFIKRRRVLR